MLKDWDAYAREFARALSRYDGHTTYAKLKTILGVVESPAFEKKASCYAAELITEVEQKGVGRVAAQAHLRHGIALGFLERVVSGGGISRGGQRTKIEETARIALSPLGRAYRASLDLSEDEFRDFLVVGAILDHDFDFYGLFLESASARGGEADAADFARNARSLFTKRTKWFEREVPSRLVRDQIRGRVPWMLRDIKDTSLKYHFHLRRQWADHLSHVGGKGRKSLTSTGSEIARRVALVACPNQMFWLSPSPECVRKMGADPQNAGSISSAWDLFRPDGEESDPSDKMTDKIAEHMEKAFGSMRLRIFAQAPLAAVAPYVHFQEFRLGRRVNLRTAFEAVLKRHRDIFHCLLAANPVECHYQLQTPPRPRPEQK